MLLLVILPRYFFLFIELVQACVHSSSQEAVVNMVESKNIFLVFGDWQGEFTVLTVTTEQPDTCGVNSPQNAAR